MPKIREYPEASLANSNDALILDSEEGTKYIKVSNLLGPLSSSSTVDRVTASGSVAHFEDGADNAPMKDVLVHIEPVQEGSGDPSPDNVRPITGWTGAKVTRTGANIIKCTGNAMHGVTVSKNADGTFHIEGTATAYAYPVNLKEITLKAGTYVFSISEIPSGATTGFGLNGTWSGKITQGKTITVADGTVLTGYIEISTGTTVNDDIAIQLELGSTATSYEPYHADTYDITFPTEAGTVYGGTLDVTKGELVVDRVCQQITTAEIKSTGVPVPAQSDSNTTYFNLRNVLTYKSVGSAEIANVNRILSDRFTSRRTTDLWNNKAIEGVSTTEGRFVSVRINASRLSEQTAEGLANYLTNGLQIFYPLATPQTYQLTPQEITSLLGTNNLWADTGNSEVEYRADTKMYIDRKVAELQALILENEGN